MGYKTFSSGHAVNMRGLTSNTALFILLHVLLVTVDVSQAEGENRGGGGSEALKLEVNQKVWVREGDLQLGVVLSMTAFHKDQLCGPNLRQPSALHRLQAIVYAIDEINQNATLLPGIKLGFVVMDDCSRDAAALLRALRFIQNPACPGGDGLRTETRYTFLTKDGGRVDIAKVVDTTVKTYNVFGVIGAELSESSMQMAALLSAFRVPQLSYASSSPFLSDKNKYGFFSRIVPSDRQQSKVIVDLLQEFQWTYVAVVYSYGVYGLSGFRYIRNALEDRGLCLAAAIATESENNEEDYDDLVDKLLWIKPEVKVVVLFTLHAKSVLRAAKRKGVGSRFVWVSSDALVPNVKDFKDFEDISVGLLVVGFSSAPVKRFEDKFGYHTILSGKVNPWFVEFYENMFNCSTNTNTTLGLCSLDLPILHAPMYERNTSVMRAIHSVYAFAYALHDVIQNCDYTRTNVSKCYTPEELLFSLTKTYFYGEGGVLVGIDSIGDGIANYQIRNLRVDDGQYSFATVGEWNGRTQNFTFLNKQAIMWHPELTEQLRHERVLLEEGAEREEMIPSSTCRETCRAGQQTVSTWPRCCWVCKDCRANEITVPRDGLPDCQTCPTDNNFTWPDPETRTRCEPISIFFLSFSSPMGVALLILDLFVLILVLTCMVLYIKNRTNRLIKATSRELSAVMLGGHLLACVAVVVFLLEPSTPSCVVGHALFHVSLTFVYAPLLVKINRIHRIFVSAKRSAKAPRFISSGFQLAVSLAVVLVHLLFIITWMLVSPPTLQTRMPNPNEKYAERVCVVSETGFLASLVFNLVLMAACAMHSLSTRKLPANFNEAKFIVICIYTIAVLWLSFLTTYFVIDTGAVHTLCFALALMVNVISCQIFLFVPKLYAVLKIPSSKLKVETENETTHTRDKCGGVSDGGDSMDNF